MLKVWGRRNAFNVQKVMWLIDELKLPHQHQPLGGNFGGLDRPDFLSMNPHGRIPVILDKQVAVWESHSILRYLAASYGQPKFWSQNPQDRAKIEPWMDWSQTVLQPDFLTGVFWGYYRTPETYRNWNAIRESVNRCSQHFQLLDKILSKQPFLCGQELTLADIPVGTCLYRYFNLDIERPKIPNVEAWYAHLQQRPAYQKNVMIPFEDLKGELTAASGFFKI